MTTARDAKWSPIEVGMRVRRTQGRAEDVGRDGEVSQVFGSIAGDTLIEITEADGSTFRCYDRQVTIS